MGYVHGARAALTQLRRQRHGVLINVSSVVDEIAQPYTAAYSVSKAGVNALSVSLRQELALEKLRNIHVVTVMPPARTAKSAARKARRRVLPGRRRS